MKNKQYPQQTGVYTVKVKSGQSTDKWQDFPMVRLQISVGQDYHEGDKLKAVADWISPRFSSAQICVNDTLQRFNLMFKQGLSEEESRLISEYNGAMWMRKNQQKFFCMPRIEIIRWDAWLNDSEYSEVRQQIDALYLSNEEFRALINRDVQDIWVRRQKMDAVLYVDDKYEEFVNLSREFLLEETAVFSMMFARSEAIDIYPGTVLSSSTIFQGREVEGAPVGLGKGHFCRIDFARNKKVIEQNRIAAPQKAA